VLRLKRYDDLIVVIGTTLPPTVFTQRNFVADLIVVAAILLQQGPVDPNFQVEGVAPTNHSSSQ